MRPYPYPDEFPADADQYISDTEEQFDERPQDKPSFPEWCIVWNLPNAENVCAVKEDGTSEEFTKAEKLARVLKKHFGEGSDPVNNPGFEIEMKIDPNTNSTYGCAMFKFPSRAKMNEARIGKGDKSIHGYPFTRKRTLEALPFDEVEEYLKIPETFVFPKDQNIIPMLKDDCRNWLLDDKGREQLLLRFQQETQIHWLDPLKGLVNFYSGEREKSQNKVWCDWKVQWSPHGNFLATCHKPGIALWGGEGMVDKRRFKHASVTNIQFSPSEEYLVTWSGGHSSGEDKAYKIWNIKSGRCEKSLATPPFSPSTTDSGFPHMIWSHDSKYLARCTEKDIFVHEMPSLELVKGEGEKAGAPIHFEHGISHFTFSPKDNILAVWSPHDGEIPPRLSLIDVTTQIKLKDKARFNFTASLHWQSEGDFLCVLLSKIGKEKKKEGFQPITNPPKKLEIFRVRQKNIPVESLDVDDNIKGFFWEPKNDRFAIITDVATSSSKSNVLFYSLQNDKLELIAQFELTSPGYSHVFWAPDGQYFVLAGIAGGVQSGGELLWGRLTENNTFELLHKEDHYSLTDVEWDPSSRYVMTSVLSPLDASASMSSAQDCGYRVWSFQGRLLSKRELEKLYHVQWRPHPLTFLTKDEDTDVRKKLKFHSKRFDQIDDRAKEKARNEIKEKRDRKIREFNALLNDLNKKFGEHAKTLMWDVAWNNFNSLHKWRDVQETIEEIIDTKEEVIDL